MVRVEAQRVLLASVLPWGNWKFLFWRPSSVRPDLTSVPFRSPVSHPSCLCAKYQKASLQSSHFTWDTGK